MPTLVIGGTGVIGHFLTRQLAQAKERPVVVTFSGNTDLIADVLDQVVVVQADISDATLISEIVEHYSIDRIANLGANTGVESNPARSARVYVEGFVNVMEAARVHQVRRVVFTSTKGVYGPVTGEYGHPTYRALTEDMPCAPATIRGAYKLAAERIGKIYRDRHGIEFASLRFSSTVGPAKTQRHDDTSVHSKMIENAMLACPAVIPNGGDAVTDIIYNDDAAKGIRLALDAAVLNETVYNIGSGQGFTLNEFGAAVRHWYPDAEFEIGPGTQYLNPETTGHCILSPDRAFRDIGFDVSYDLPGIVKAYVGMMETLGIPPIRT